MKHSNLVTVLGVLSKGTTVHLQRRHHRYMFGCLNYGEVTGFINGADGDPWDVFAPGYEEMLPDGDYTSCGVIGVLLVSNGNHKIAVRINQPGYKARRGAAEQRRYSRTYLGRMKLQGNWLWCDRVLSPTTSDAYA